MMPLAMAETGRENTILRVGGKEETRRFLENLGFVTGSRVTVVSEINGNVIVSVKTVSYTHLDVYKRQGGNWRLQSSRHSA